MYDIKYLMKFCDNLHGGLNKLAEVLQVERIGPQHQVLLLALCLHHSSVGRQEPSSAACWQDSVSYRGTSGCLNTSQALGVAQRNVSMFTSVVMLIVDACSALHCWLFLLWMCNCALVLLECDLQSPAQAITPSLENAISAIMLMM